MRYNEASKLIAAKKEVIAMVKSVTTDMGTMAVTHFTKSFSNQGFEDQSIKRWQPRKGEISGGIGRVRKRDRGSRAILVKSGALRRSLRWHRSGLTGVTITSNVPYAGFHNYGVRGRLPIRQFVGDSAKLNSKIIRRIESRVNRIFK